MMHFFSIMHVGLVGRAEATGEERGSSYTLSSTLVTSPSCKTVPYLSFTIATRDAASQEDYHPALKKQVYQEYAYRMTCGFVWKESRVGQVVPRGRIQSTYRSLPTIEEFVLVRELKNFSHSWRGGGFRHRRAHFWDYCVCLFFHDLG